MFSLASLYPETEGKTKDSCQLFFILPQNNILKIFFFCRRMAEKTEEYLPERQKGGAERLESEIFSIYNNKKSKPDESVSYKFRMVLRS